VYADGTCCWDVSRRIQLKTLKQRIRSLVQPSRDLGHSDEKGHAAVA
jgi:predicted Rdx family selenoprotein